MPEADHPTSREQLEALQARVVAERSRIMSTEPSDAQQALDGLVIAVAERRAQARGTDWREEVENLQSRVNAKRRQELDLEQ